MTEIRVVVAEGDAFQRGVHIGRELGDLIERSLGFYQGYLERRGVSSRQLQDILSPYFGATESSLPEWTAVIKGMSVGATVPTFELFAVNAFEELEPLLRSPEEGGTLFLQHKAGGQAPEGPPEDDRADHCASIALRTSSGSTLIGHNEHWLAGDSGNVAVVIDMPTDRVPVASPTIVCCLPAVGLNGHGGSQGIGSLTAADDGVGIPRVLVSRGSLEARDRAEAVARAALPGRAGGYGHVFAFAEGNPFVVETTASEHRLLDEVGVHTNHYLSDLADRGSPPSEGSLERLERIERALALNPPEEPDDLMQLMRDHVGGPEAICCHPGPNEGDDAATVAFSMVADVTAGRMWVAAGNPCEHAFDEIDLTPLRSWMR